nr:envelope protein [Bat coronavirus]
MLRLVDDPFILNALLWAVILMFVLLILCVLRKMCQVAIICHGVCNETVYQPVVRVYRLYKEYMRIEPLPVFEV